MYIYICVFMWKADVAKYTPKNPQISLSDSNQD